MRIRTCIAKPLHGARRSRSQWRRSSLAIPRARFSARFRGRCSYTGPESRILSNGIRDGVFNIRPRISLGFSGHVATAVPPPRLPKRAIITNEKLLKKKNNIKSSRTSRFRDGPGCVPRYYDLLVQEPIERHADGAEGPTGDPRPSRAGQAQQT